MANIVLTLEQYAAHCRVSLKTVYNWINSGKIKPTVIGKHKFITIKK